MAYAHAFQCLRRAARRVPGVFTLPCLWGLLLLLVTVFLWTATALLLQELFLKTFPRPLFSTLVQSACPVVFLFPPAAAALRSTNAWKRGGTDKGLKAPIWQVALAGFLGKEMQQDLRRCCWVRMCIEHTGIWTSTRVTMMPRAHI